LHTDIGGCFKPHDWRTNQTPEYNQIVFHPCGEWNAARRLIPSQIEADPSPRYDQRLQERPSYLPWGGAEMGYEAINFDKKFKLFDDQWKPKVIAEMNDYQFKVVRLQGDFVWHDHKDTDETFIVLEGDLRIDFRDGAVHLSAGEMFVVPKGVQHKPYAEQEVKLLLVEPRGVLNTGHEGGERTAGNDVWI
jgi:mannose-6-phosphate isomerase-like protein (cupin superfamily)